MNLLSAGDTETPGLEGSWIQMGEPSTKTETKTNSPHPPPAKKKKTSRNLCTYRDTAIKQNQMKNIQYDSVKCEKKISRRDRT
jgi:hypothetical protein